jgi:translation elongation factor EF-Tu-like GTPase
LKYSAIVRFLCHEEGGRFSPPLSGYKPQLRIENEFTSCIITTKYNSNEVMEFGVDYDVFIELLYADIYKNKITKRMRIELYEGNKLVGKGVFVD